MKIDHNPFAKGFRDTGAGKREKKRHPSCLGSLTNGGDHCIRIRDGITIHSPRNSFATDGNDSDTSEDYEGPAAKRPKSSASSVNTSAGNEEETPPPVQNGIHTNGPKPASTPNKNSVSVK